MKNEMHRRSIALLLDRSNLIVLCAILEKLPDKSCPQYTGDVYYTISPQLYRMGENGNIVVCDICNTRRSGKVCRGFILYESC